MAANLPGSELSEAIRHFWSIRGSQAATQSGSDPDRGERGAVTGGKQMDGFLNLIQTHLINSGIERKMIYCRTRSDESARAKRSIVGPDGWREPHCKSTQLPGWFRPEKDWDLLVVVNGSLIAALELKSHVGPSFGNNFNNRSEEALGNGLDIQAAYREGAFRPSLRPWLGYLMLLEAAHGSRKPVRPTEPHFRVFEEFRNASYENRYESLLTKMLRERLYDACCLLTSPRDAGLSGSYFEPNAELSFLNFLMSFVAHASTVAKLTITPSDSVTTETLDETQRSQDK